MQTTKKERDEEILDMIIKNQDELISLMDEIEKDRLDLDKLYIVINGILILLISIAFFFKQYELVWPFIIGFYINYSLYVHYYKKRRKQYDAYIQQKRKNSKFS